MIPRTAPVHVAIAVLALTELGCAPGALVADEAGLLGDDTRHYATGSHVALELLGPDLAVTSTDETVLAVVADDGALVLEARAEGEATLLVTEASDRSIVLARHPIVVAPPTAARILPADAPSMTDDERMIAIAGTQLDVLLVLEADGVELVGRGDVALIASQGLVLESDVGTHQVLVGPETEDFVVEALAPSGAILATREVEVL